MSAGTQMNIRLRPTERARFNRVAKRLGLSIADALRLLMKLADDSYKKGAQRAKPWGNYDHR